MSALLLKALRREETPRRPVWIMRQAGRILPEYRKLRESTKFEQLCDDPELATEVTMMPLRRFPLDAAIIFADLMSPVKSLGIDYHFDPGPIVPEPLRRPSDLARLNEPSPQEIAPEVIETHRRVKPQLNENQALLGFAGAPWTLAGYLVQGRGGKSEFALLRALMTEDPKFLGDLLHRLAQLCTDYLKEQVKAGADAVQVFDSWAGLLSESDWREHIQSPLRAMLEELGRAGIPRILFAQGAPHLVDCYSELPCEALAVCWRTDLGKLAQKLEGRLALQGNLDPALLMAGPAAVRSAVDSLLRRVPRRGHIMNLGHGVLPETPLESVQALLDAVHEETPAS